MCFVDRGGPVFHNSFICQTGSRNYHCLQEKTVADSFGSWDALASFAAAASTVLLILFALLALNYAAAVTYEWMSAAQAALGIAMIGLIAHGIADIRKTKPTKKQKFCHWAVVIALVITVANIAYWNLFMWWKI